MKTTAANLSTADTADVDVITLDTNVSATMTSAQNDLITTAAGTNTVTLTDATTHTGKAAVDAYQLAAGTQSITLGAAGQNVTLHGTGSSGTVTIDTGSFTTVSGTFDDNGGNDTITLNVATTSADISSVDITDVDVITLDLSLIHI